MQEAPDFKKLHAVSSLAGEFCSAVKVYPETYEDPTAVSVQGLSDIDWKAEEILVPDRMVGLIIGRGGDVISRLQIECGAKIQMAPDSGGLPDRSCTLTGTSTAIGMAKRLIEEIISNETKKAASKATQPPLHVHEMMIPGNLVARVIGKGGDVIKALQEESGARVVIIQDSKEYATEKPMRITGTMEVVEKARQKVEQILSAEQQKLELIKRGWTTNNNNFGLGISLGQDIASFDVTEVISVPSSKVGLVMGRGGETIREICLVSGAHCQVDKAAPEGAREKNILIKGRPEAVQRAKIMVTERVGGMMDRGFDSGVMTDYSPQWAEYYRSLGMVKEAELIEQQMSARAQSCQGGPQPDYRAQWAVYYRALGNYKEAEEIEKNLKLKEMIDLSQCQPVYSTDLNLFNHGVKLSKWDYK